MSQKLRKIKEKIAKLETEARLIESQYNAYSELAIRCKNIIEEVDLAVKDTGLSKSDFYAFCGLPTASMETNSRRTMNKIKTYKNPIEGQPNILCGRLTKELIAYRHTHGAEALEQLRIS